MLLGLHGRVHPVEQLHHLAAAQQAGSEWAQVNGTAGVGAGVSSCVSTSHRKHDLVHELMLHTVLENAARVVKQHPDRRRQTPHTE